MALISATQHAMPPEIGDKSSVNTRFHVPTLLYARYNVKLKKYDKITAYM